ncbi:hypothetical protein BJ912DRAFT_642035 [Pholiota molesta]|nr:hypothetical protein BJ912DRAFT_642035 [Pholiota molesta]
MFGTPAFRRSRHARAAARSPRTNSARNGLPRLRAARGGAGRGTRGAGAARRGARAGRRASSSARCVTAGVEASAVESSRRARPSSHTHAPGGESASVCTLGRWRAVDRALRGQTALRSRVLRITMDSAVSAGRVHSGGCGVAWGECAAERRGRGRSAPSEAWDGANKGEPGQEVCRESWVRVESRVDPEKLTIRDRRRSAGRDGVVRRVWSWYISVRCVFVFC